jgi:hypothetical protein
MFKKMIVWVTLGVLLLAACAQARSSEVTSSYDEGFAPSAPMMDEQKAMESTTNSVMSTGGFVSTEPATVERMVLKNANISIAVDDPPAVMERITTMAEEMGGFVVSANLYQTTLEGGIEVPHVSITVRVPAELLYQALAKIKAETQQPVINETISSQDVTADYTDLQSRLVNLEAAEKQLQGIMDEATKTEDVLNVFNQLTQVREQIEVIKGQMQYYEQSAALSAVSVELYANEAVRPVTIGGWQPKGVAKQALQALVNTLKFLATAAIWIIILVLPVLIVVFLPPALIILAVLRWRKRRKAKATPPVP